MTDLSQYFYSRANRIPFLGLGLSVDVYSPHLFDLSAALNHRDLSVGYFEIFHAHPHALHTIRTHLSKTPMAYHAEGLWLTQPGWVGSAQADFRLEQVAQETALLEAWWVNQECATKEIAGSVFGTYVPPLFTKDSARLTGQQACDAQERLDACQWGKQGPPLLLLEVPPLTYFRVGDLSYSDFFRRVADSASCGFVLDIGHVWTAYRYGGACHRQRFEAFIETLLDEFPLDRVIQIHIAGLACHPSVSLESWSGLGAGPPPWVDSHPDPIPQELFMALGKILSDTRLRNVKGLALEVDNKGIAMTCQEFALVQKQFGPHLERIRQCFVNEENMQRQEEPLHVEVAGVRSLASRDRELAKQYADYVLLLSGKMMKGLAGSVVIPPDTREGIQVYSSQYLPQEILSWGGDLSEMFPLSCEALKRHGVGLERFLEFWFTKPCLERHWAYDFFLMKIQRFVEFVHVVLPAEAFVAEQEAEVLREGYRLSCEEVIVADES